MSKKSWERVKTNVLYEALTERYITIDAKSIEQIKYYFNEIGEGQFDLVFELKSYGAEKRQYLQIKEVDTPGSIHIDCINVLKLKSGFMFHFEIYESKSFFVTDVEEFITDKMNYLLEYFGKHK
jgi:hypothetical protein